MATIRKRGSSSSYKYHVQVRRKGHSSITRTFHLLKDAEAWARHLERQADRQELPPDPRVLSKVTLGDLIIRYRDTVSTRKRTCHTEQIVLNALLRRPICSRLVSELRMADFALYRDQRLLEIKPSSLRRELTPVRHLFEVARQEWGLPLRDNPVAKLAIVGADQRRERRLNPGELELIFRAAQASRNKLILPIIALALLTGMRRGEMLAMKWSDIDKQGNALLIPITKSGKARVIPLHEGALQVLDCLPRSGERVFPLSANGFRLAWERLKRRAGLIDLHFHDLRHEAISRLFEAGLSIPEVALISGHRDPRMLFRYTHPLRQQILGKLAGSSYMKELMPPTS